MIQQARQENPEVDSRASLAHCERVAEEEKGARANLVANRREDDVNHPGGRGVPSCRQHRGAEKQRASKAGEREKDPAGKIMRTNAVQCPPLDSLSHQTPGLVLGSAIILERAGEDAGFLALQLFSKISAAISFPGEGGMTRLWHLICIVHVAGGERSFTYKIWCPE